MRTKTYDGRRQKLCRHTFLVRRREANHAGQTHMSRKAWKSVEEKWKKAPCKRRKRVAGLWDTESVSAPTLSQRVWPGLEKRELQCVFVQTLFGKENNVVWEDCGVVAECVCEPKVHRSCWRRRIGFTRKGCPMCFWSVASECVQQTYTLIVR